MAFDAKTISMILSILLGVFVLWGTIWGIIRGLKNSLWRGVFIIAVMVVAFFVSTLTTKLLLGNIPITVNDVEYQNINECVAQLVKDNIQTTADTTGAVNGVLSVVLIAINSFIFVALFWILKWTLSPVYSLLRRHAFDKNHYKKEEVTKGNKTKIKTVKVKNKRYRLAGGLVGMVLGLLVCTFTMTPIVGYLNIAQNVEKTSRKNNATETGLICDLIGEENYNIVYDGYNGSVYSKVMKYSGMEFLSGAMFNTLSSTKVEGVKIKLNDEVQTGLEVYDAVTKLEMPDLETCTADELNTFLVSCRTITNSAFKSGIVNASLELIMPIVVDYVEQTDMIQDLTGAKKVFAINALENLLETHSSEIKTEVLSMIGLVQTLNDYGLAIPVLQNDTGNIIDFLKLTTNRAVVTDVTEKMFALNTVDKVAPDIANIMIEYICEALSIENESVENITSAQLKSSLQNILYAMVDILPNLDSSSDYIITKNAISGVGKVIDAIKDAEFVTNNMFEAIIGEVQDQLYQLTDGVPDWALSIANEAIDNLSNISNFTTEFGKIYTIVDDIDKACRDNNGERSTKLADIKFDYIGEALDTLQTLVLVSRVNPPEGEANNLVTKLAVEALKTYSEDLTINSTKLNSFASVTQIQENIANQGTTIDWSVALPNIKQLIVSAENLANDSTDLTSKLKDDTQKQEFIDLGKALDSASNTTLFANGVDRKFMTDLLDIVDDSYTDDSDMLNAITSIKSNILTAPSITWENEFGNIVELVNMDFDNVLSADETPAGEQSKAYKLGNTIDTVVANSHIITENIIDTFICSVVDTNFSGTTYQNMVDIVKNTFSDVDGNTENGYQNGIDYYALEFDALNTLYQARSVVDDGEFNLETDAEELGQKIDKALATSITIDGTTYTTKLVSSELIDTFIKDVLDTKFDDSDPDFAEALTMIKAKFSDVDKNAENGYQNGVQNYTVEFKALGKLQQIVDYVNGTDFAFKTNGQDLGELIDIAITMTFETYLTQVVTKELVDTYVRKLLDKYIDDTSDTNLSITKQNIIAKFNKVGTGEYNNGVVYYEVEFKALANLLSSVVDASFDVSTESGRTALGTALDSVTTTYIEKSTTKYYTRVVIPEVINPYIKTKLSDITVDADYESVKETMIDDIKDYLDSIDGTTKTYARCFTDVNTLSSKMDEIDTTDATFESSTLLAKVEGEIDAIQNTSVFSAKLGRKIMLVVLEKMADYYKGKITNSSLVDEHTKSLRAYKEYLTTNLSSTTNEPYTSETSSTTSVTLDGESVTVRTNKPLQDIYEKIKASLGA